MIASRKNEAPDQNIISEQTEGVAFMGTPFEGSEQAKWASRGEKILDLLHLGKYNSQVLENLAPKSAKLANLGVDFPDWLGQRRKDPKTQIRIMCFFEDRPEPKVGLIVSPESAKIAGYPDRAMHATHTGMCKYENKTDPNYQEVLGVLRRWIDKIITSKKEEDVRQDPRPVISFARISCRSS